MIENVKTWTIMEGYKIILYLSDDSHILLTRGKSDIELMSIGCKRIGIIYTGDELYGTNKYIISIDGPTRSFELSDELLPLNLEGSPLPKVLSKIMSRVE